MRRLLPAFLPILYTLYSILYTVPAVAGDYQQCTTSSTCTIGEYLYNDDYTALTGASCTLTAKYPDGTTYLNGVAMTGASDGWYKYDASLGTTEGLYHATICCTPSSGLMCLDKTFEVKAPPQAQLTAADVWNYSTRSLTTFGSLISDLWGHSTRTLTSFGTLVTDITGIASPSPSTPATLQTILSEQKTQRELLEKLVNAPIVTLSLEDNETPDLSAKLDESKKQAELLYDAVQSTKSRLLTLDEKWPRLQGDALSKELTSLSQIWTDPSALTSLSNAWNTPIIDSLNQTSTQIKSQLTALLASATINKSPLPPPTLLATIASLSSLEATLGDVTSTSGDTTFFGYLSSVSERDSLLESENQKLSAILEDWDSQGEAVLEKKVKTSQARLLTINEFPGGEEIITPSNPQASGLPAQAGKTALKNLVFSLQGLIGLNHNLLASNVNAPVRGLWLEEGSIIFRAVITNPSSLVTQSAPLKFYLPKELQSGDIITIHPDLTASYDTMQETLAVTGDFELKPGTTKIMAVEVQDVWQLSSDELAGLKTKAEELVGSLGKSNLLSQGIVLKSSIVSDLDKLLSQTGKNVKPENRIRSYREAQLALATTKANLTQLENLVAQASSSNSIIGFVGGVSTTAVFGIILVIVAGFVFMSTYFKKLNSSPAPVWVDPRVDPEPLTRLSPLPTAPAPSGAAGGVGWQMPAIIAVVVVVTAGGTLLLTQATKPKPTPVINQVIVATPSPSPSPTPSPSPSPVPDVSQGTVSPQSILVVPSDSTVNVRNQPAPDADIIMKIGETEAVYVFKEEGDWRQIGFSEADKTKGYWVHSKFIEEK